MQLTLRDFPSTVSSLPSVDEAREIIAYEPPARIAWAKLIEDTYLPQEGMHVKKVHIGTLSGRPAWSDGHVMVIEEPPARLKALKKYYEVYGPEGRPRDFDHLIPDIPPESPLVEPLATIVGDRTRPDIVYLADADRRYEICIQKKYIDYFTVYYTGVQFVMITDVSPLVVEFTDELVGLIMPIRVDDNVLLQVRDFLRPPPPPPPPEELVKVTLEQIIEFDREHTLDELKKMAREKGLSTSGTKHEIIARLLES